MLWIANLNNNLQNQTLKEKGQKEKTKNQLLLWRKVTLVFAATFHIRETVYNRLISLGATENEKPYNTGGEIMTATLKEPFGNVIGLIYNPYFKLK